MIFFPSNYAMITSIGRRTPICIEKNDRGFVIGKWYVKEWKQGKLMLV